MRPSRLLAIARRDLAQTIQGRRGIVLNVVTAVLIIPAATIPIRAPTQGFEPATVVVLGEVPESVLTLDGVVRGTTDQAHLIFTTDDDGRLIVRGPSIPARVRRALDGETPDLVVERTVPSFPMPGRTALLALISASVLTGGISESIGGERSRKTLQALLAAAITRNELVVGKWLAWSGYAACAVWIGALAAMISGRATPGWWLLPLPMVAAGTVALGLYLVRHTSDVVSSAAVSLRVLPALLTVTGLVSWYFADIQPIAAAALPVGGALLASGSTWDGPVAPIVSTLSTGAFCAVLLWRTARDLERPAPPPSSVVRRVQEGVLVTALAALCWWLPIASPLLWGAAGNPGLTERLPTTPGIVAAALGLLAMCGLRMGRVSEPLASLGLTRTRAYWFVVAVLGTIGVGAFFGSTGLSFPTPFAAAPELVQDAGDRLARAVIPFEAGIGVGVLTALAQELVFRGWLQRLLGPVFSTGAFIVVVTPYDPLSGALFGGLLALLTWAADGSVLPALTVRLVLLVLGLTWTASVMV